MVYGSNQIEKRASHFKDPLGKANFDRRLVHKEWRQLNKFAKSHYSGLVLTHFGKNIHLQTL